MSKKLFKCRYLASLDDGHSDGYHTDHSDHDLSIDDSSSTTSASSHFATFVPKMVRRIKNFDSHIECQGCHEKFPCYQDNRLTLPAESYFVHCVEKCPQYRSLNLMRNCDQCHQTFLNATRLGVHRQRHHRQEQITTKKPRKKRTRPLSKVTRTVLRRYASYEEEQSQDQSNDSAPSPITHTTITEAAEEHYEPFIPKIVAKRIKSYNAEINCKGCGKSFPCSQYAKECHPSKSYYVHCIEQCPKYAELGLVRACDKCRLKFIDPKNLGNHLLHHHRAEREELIKSKPKWMSYITLKNIMTFASYTDRTPCKGCGKELPCIKRGRHSQYSLEFYRHCIEECDFYKRLGLISQCTRCHYVFINQQALRNHKCVPDEEGNNESLLHHSGAVKDEDRVAKKPKIETPEWMSEGIARNIKACGTYPDITRCRGCGAEFHYRKAGTTNHYSLEYYKHCIEECKEYKKLGLVEKCEKCDKLFLNKLAYAHHRC